MYMWLHMRAYLITPPPLAGLVLPMHPQYYAQTQATMQLLAQAGYINLLEMDVVTWSPACMTITRLCHRSGLKGSGSDASRVSADSGADRCVCVGTF